MSSSSLRKPAWTFLYLDIVSFFLEEKSTLGYFNLVEETEFLSRRAFFGIFSGGCLILNVDHFGDRRSPISARVCGMEVQLSDMTIFGGDTGEDPVGRSEYPDRPKPM
jgi:hypothetical protein